MNLYPELVQALADASPFVLVVVISLVALVGMAVFTIRGVTPAIGRIIEQQSEASKKQDGQHEEIVAAWRTLLGEQNRVNAMLAEGLKRELDEERRERADMEIDLRRRISELQGEIDEKTRQLDEAKARIGELEKKLELVRADRDKLQAERDDLKRKVEKLTNDVERLRKELRKYQRDSADHAAGGDNGMHPASGNPDAYGQPGCNGKCACKPDADPDGQSSAEPDAKSDGQSDGDAE